MRWLDRFIAAMRGANSELEPVVCAPPSSSPPATPDPILAEPTEPLELEPELDEPKGEGWLEQLGSLLKDAGVRDFTARELTWLPKAKPAARVDMPPRELWPALVAVAKLAQEVRDEYGEPLWVSSCWRPRWYNEAVGGSKASQHMNGAAIDLNPLPSSRTPERTKQLEQATAKVWLENPTARGFGVYAGARTHIDVGGARRKWGEAKRVLDELEEMEK